MDPDPVRVGSEWPSLEEYVRCCRQLAERQGFKVQRAYRSSQPTKCKVQCSFCFGSNKCNWYIVLRRIKAEEAVGANEWFIAEVSTEHTGHLPTAIDPRQMIRDEERMFTENFSRELSLRTPPSPELYRSRSAPISPNGSASTSRVLLCSDDTEPIPSPTSARIGVTVDELSHLTPSSNTSELLESLNLPVSEYSVALNDEGVESIEDLLWLGAEELKELLDDLRPQVKKAHALRLVSAVRVLNERLGRRGRVKMEPLD